MNYKTGSIEDTAPLIQISLLNEQIILQVLTHLHHFVKLKLHPATGLRLNIYFCVSMAGPSAPAVLPTDPCGICGNKVN